jgi:NAD(P)-dependent dehydrogenase (short-subunit alcohol dehydrogenase family)
VQGLEAELRALGSEVRSAVVDVTGRVARLRRCQEWEWTSVTSMTAAQAARPYLREGARSTVTGSMAADQPWNKAASLGVQKAGIRNLVHSLDATVKPDGIRAVSVTVRGALSAEGPFTPDRVAEALYSAAHRADEEWRTEIAYEG